MRKIIVLGSTSKGHAGYYPVNPTRGITNVRAGKRPVVVEGTPYYAHDRRNSPYHTGYAIARSRVFARKQRVQLEGDPNTCGDTASNGYSRVKIR